MRHVIRVFVTALLLVGVLLTPVPTTAEPARAAPGAGTDRWDPVTTVLGTRSRLSPTADGERALWTWPLAGLPPVVRRFDPPPQPWLPGHRGIDLAGTAGEPVLAVDAGVVSYSGVIAGVGNVSITHGNGIRSTYQPVADRVPQGTRVRRGQIIGSLDPAGTHCPPRACLHLGAKRSSDDYLDPLLFLQGAELTLRPVHEGASS